MKLTPELLAQAPSALNPIKERELNLRGENTASLFLAFSHRIPQATKSRSSKTWVLRGYAQVHSWYALNDQLFCRISTIV